MVTIVEPDPRWPEEFDRIAAEIRSAVAPVERVDHIGSTSVPGLAAKDVIDVQVTVPDWEAVEATLERLADDGWTVYPDIGRDHAVPGLPDASDLWAKGFANERPDDRPIHVHVRVTGRPNQRYALLFRDFLRAHADAAAAYGELKRRLAPLAPDSATYADAKDPACDLIYLAAEAWASQVGWDPVRVADVDPKRGSSDQGRSTA
jgi:GrpB-like predicted nucleotidyltransferase (UPF0157 family)